MTAPPLAAVVLAAGGSRRLGRPKMLLEIGGRTLVARAVAAALEAGLARVVLVLGGAAAQVRASGGWGDDPRVEVVVNEEWAEGMAGSIRRGVERCREAEAVLVMLADQPDLDARRVRAVVEAWDGRAPLVVPVGAERAGHPVLFARALYGELLALRGDVGARAVVERHWAAAITVPLPDLADVDTDEDYRAARARHPRDTRGTDPHTGGKLP